MDALSVHHARPLEGYRQTLELRTESASTEQLREALIRHRSLFEDLTGLRGGHGVPGRHRVAAIREGGAEHRTADHRAGDHHTAEPVAGDPAAENDKLAAENASRTADTPR